MYGVIYYDEYNEDNVCYEFIYDVPNNGIVNMFIYNFFTDVDPGENKGCNCFKYCECVYCNILESIVSSIRRDITFKQLLQLL